MPYWKKLTTLIANSHVPVLTRRYQAAATWRAAVMANQLPPTPLPVLALNEVDFATAVLAGVAPPTVVTIDHLLRNFRQYIAYHFGMWAFVNQQLCQVWQATFGPLRYLEVAAGNGFLSYGLRQAGVKVIATDSHTWLSENVTGQTPLLPVATAASATAVWRYGAQVDAVVMAWSPDRDPNDVHVLHLLRRFFPQLLFFVIGERFGATNSQLFWQEAQFVPDRRLLALNRAMPRFDTINDRIYLMR